MKGQTRTMVRVVYFDGGPLHGQMLGAELDATVVEVRRLKAAPAEESAQRQQAEQVGRYDLLANQGIWMGWGPWRMPEPAV